MQVAINAMREFLLHLRSRVVRLMCDNAETVAYIKNEGGTRSYTLMQMTLHLLKWCDRKVITLVPVHLPGVHNIQADSLSRVGQTLNMEWTMAMEHLRPVFAQWDEPQVHLFATFANRQPWSLHRRIWTPGPSSRTPCQCPGTTGGASCMPFRHSRWSLEYCRRSLSLQVFSWFWWLLCRKHLHGSRSCWICPKKIPSRCTSSVNRCWLKTSCWPTGWQRLVTTDRQIYTRGNSTGHPNGQGPF